MASAAHKRIIFAGMGCAAALIALMVGGVVLLLQERPSFFADLATVAEYGTPASSEAALDSLDGMSWAALSEPRADRLSLAAGRSGAGASGNGAQLALAVWANRRFQNPLVPYGDTAADTSRRGATWRSYAVYAGIDSLLQAALLPWRISAAMLGRPDSSRGIIAATINPYAPMNSTRAMLARAAAPAVPRDTVERIARAVVTIGRALQQDVALVHVVTGLRIERDALAFLARRGSAEAERALPGVERALAVGLRGLHLIRVAGAMATHATVLAQGAADAKLPLAVRREMLLAIGYGWALNAQETGAFTGRRERGDALDGLKPASLPSSLRPALVSARHGAGLAVASRMLIGPEYQTLTAALRMVW